MTDLNDALEGAVTAGLQAANDHTALDAEWLRKFTRGVLAHHVGLPPLNYERLAGAEVILRGDTTGLRSGADAYEQYLDTIAKNGPRDDA